MPRALQELIAGLPEARLPSGAAAWVTGVQYDSRRVRPGDLFACLKGLREDGHDYAPEAVERGAAAVLAEREIPNLGAPQVIVPESRLALALVAAAFFDHPSRKLRLFGVTGTNGKTTTTHLIKAILEAGGTKTGLLGTIHNLVGGQKLPARLTTPESVDLLAMLAQMVDAGARAAVMEASSHALALRRTAGCEFDVAVFTNLTQDHLDFHSTFTDYLEAKSRLFAELSDPPIGLSAGPGSAPAWKRQKWAVVNMDDPHAARLARSATAPVVTYGIDHDADCVAHSLEIRPDGVRYAAHTPAGEIPLALRLTGRFNVYNSLAAVAVGVQEGVPLERIRAALEAVPGVAGRFEPVRRGQPFSVVIDYAHTPDGLENVLRTAREVCEGRLIAVFGCGGDRDRTKRPVMGQIAARYADRVIITSDNPRSEEPAPICREIEAGVREGGLGPDAYEVIIERREAIDRAIGIAQPGDLVLIAGKGHEPYQIFRDRTIHFDDREEATRALAAAGWEGERTACNP